MSALTLAEAAERLGLSASTLRWQITNGKLRADKLGTQWIVDEAEVERYRLEHQGKLGRPAVVKG